MKIRSVIAPLVFAGLAASSAQAAVDGSQQGVIAPTFYSTSPTATQSYIRLFGGAGTAGTNTTFVVTLEGVPSGAQYGSSFTLNIPYAASVQFSVGQLLGFAGNGNVPASDTGYAVYLRSADPEAGYTHVTYNPVSSLFENMSVCASPLAERMFPLHNRVVLPNVHTSKVGGGNYPSTIYLYNPTLQPTQYTLNIFNGGNAAASGLGVTANSGKRTCQYQTQVQPNSIAVIPEATLEAAPGCTIDSDQFYSNILIDGNSLTPPIATHLVRASAYSGDINLSQICAVNKAPLLLTAIPFIGPTATPNITYQLSGAAAIQVFNITGLSQTASGGAVVSATPAANPTATVVTTSTGFNFTMPDGKTANINTVPQSQTFGELARYEGLTTDGTRSVEIFMNARRAATLSFATYGYWVEGGAGGDQPMAIGTIAIGAPTALTAVPVSGNLVYTGRYSGFVGTATNTGTVTNATASLTFNFVTKTVTGSISSVVLGGVDEFNSGTGPSNSLNLTGTITDNTFTGTVTPGPAPSGAFIDITGATGTFSGTINGPSGLEVVGNINMTIAGGAGVGAVFGARAN